jgi:Rieske Fe-S protein
MRGRLLIVLTVVLVLLVGYATLSALRGGQASNRGTTIDVATLRPGHAVPVSVTLPGAHRTRARVFLVRPTGRPVLALLGVSTHLGCRLLFRGDATFDEGFAAPEQVAFEDPCGGSTFALDGRCIGGPCPRDLDRYPVELAHDAATFDLHDLVRGPARGTASAATGRSVPARR